MHSFFKQYFIQLLVFSLSLIFIPFIIQIISEHSSANRDLSSQVNTVFAFMQLAGIALTLLSAIIGSIIIYKEKRAETVLYEADAKDDIWDTQTMKVDARRIFYKVQDAWGKKDASLISDCCTMEFFLFFQRMINEKKQRKESDSIRDVDIEETRIICCQDFQDNSKDKFVVYFKGNLDEPILNESDDMVNDENTKQVFAEMYHFIRVGNDWILDKVNDNANLGNLVFTENIFES